MTNSCAEREEGLSRLKTSSGIIAERVPDAPTVNDLAVLHAMPSNGPLWVTAHQSARSIASMLGRSPSTVSREMSRNGGCDRYRAALADENAWARSRCPKWCKLANSPRLRRAVAGKLRLDWSPEQIAGRLKRTHPEDECNQVSRETIYRSLFVQTRGVLKKELLSHLRSKRSMRRSQPVDPMAIDGGTSRTSSQFPCLASVRTSCGSGLSRTNQKVKVRNYTTVSEAARSAYN